VAEGSGQKRARGFAWGLAQADISRIERGQIAPTVPTLLKLADALGAQIQFVLPPADDAADSETAHEVFALSAGA